MGKQQTDTYRTKGKPWLIVCAACIAIAASALYIIASISSPLWVWRLGELQFHESWSEAQREDFRYIDDALLHFRTDALVQKFFCNDEEISCGATPDAPLIQAHSLRHRFLHKCLLLAGNAILADCRNALKYAARTGKGSLPKHRNFDNMTAAHLACSYGREALLRELVQRGADLNLEYEMTEDSVIDTAFQNCLLPGELRLPPAQRLSLLDYLHEQGVDLARRNSEDGLSKTLMSACTHSLLVRSDHGEMLRWLIEHGVTPTREEDEVILTLLSLEGSLPMVQDLYRKKLLDDVLAPAETGHKLLLQTLLNSATEDTPQKQRWILEELGVDPTRPLLACDEDECDSAGREIHPGDSFAEICLRELHTACQHIPKGGELWRQQAEHSLTALELLLAKGCKPEPEWIERYAPGEAELRERYFRIIRQDKPRQGE